MSADLLEAFGSGTQSIVSQTREFSSQTDAGRTRDISTEDHSIQILPTQSQETIWVPQHLSDNAWSQPAYGKDVLFDANVYEAADAAQVENGDDEFGDFEQANSGSIRASSELTSAKPAAQTSSLLDLDVHETSSPSLGQFTTSSEPASQVTTNTEMPEMSHLMIAEQTDLHTEQLIEDEDEWGQFEDVNSTDFMSAVKHNREKSMDFQPPPKRIESFTASKGGQKSKSTDQATLYREETSDDAFNEDWDEFDEEKPELPAANAAWSRGNAQESIKTPTRSQEVRGDRPTNVPPPAILLSLFPKVFPLLYAQAEQTPNDGMGTQVLEAYRACARIIACRQLRWKRDTVLTQSMRIGAAGRSGGMKLTTLDKGETRREEQDAQEAISSWSRLSHKLNAVMVKAKIAKPPASLSTTLAMRVATGADVLTSNHICPICGLKRNERINGIDVNIVDIFGEFWIEHWGHRDCHEIWYTYNHLLDQR